MFRTLFSVMAIFLLTSIVVSAQELTLNSEAQVYAINPDGLRMRSCPSISCEKTAEIPTGTIVALVEGPVNADGYNWWHIRLPDGRQGWSVESADGIKTLIPLEFTSSQITSTPVFSNAPSADWRVRGFIYITTLQANSADVSAIVFSPDGKKLATYSYKEIVIWDTLTWQILKILSGQEEVGVLNSMSFNSDGSKLAAGYRTKFAIWDLIQDVHIIYDNGTFGTHDPQNPNQVLKVRYTPDGKYILTAQQDGNVYWRNPTNGLPQMAKTFGETDFLMAGVPALDISPDSSRFVVSNTMRNTAVVQVNMDSTTDHFMQSIGDVSILELEYSGDGLKIAGAVQGGMIVVWDSQTGKIISMIPGEPDALNGIYAITFHPSGLLVAANNSFGSIAIWDVNSMSKVTELPGYAYEYAIRNNLAFSPEGGLLLLPSSKDMSKVEVWLMDAEVVFEHLQIPEGNISDTLNLPELPTSEVMGLVQNSLQLLQIGVAARSNCAPFLPSGTGHPTLYLALAGRYLVCVGSEVLNQPDVVADTLYNVTSLISKAWQYLRAIFQ